MGREVFRHVYYIAYTEKPGKFIEIITVNGATKRKCSRSDVDLYAAGEHLQAK
jgi:hypothetical protein